MLKLKLEIYTCLEKQNCVNYLGVKIDRDLSWRTHIDHLHRQCMAKMAVIGRASCYLPQNVRRLLYQAFVLAHVDYYSVVWNHCGVTLRDCVERIQKYALRIIHRKPPRTSSEPLRRALYTAKTSWLPWLQTNWRDSGYESYSGLIT